MSTVRYFEDLEVWKLARELSDEIYQLTHANNFPRDYGYIGQINDAAGSIMDNIAEGFERAGRLEFINLLSYAKGSTGEVRSQLYRAMDRKYFDLHTSQKLLEKTTIISKKIASFIFYLNQQQIQGAKFKNRVKP